MDGQDRSDAGSEGRSMGQGGKEVGDKDGDDGMGGSNNSSNSSQSGRQSHRLVTGSEITNLFYFILF